MTRVVETLEARGHTMITAAHETSFELTKESYLTRKGDCIVAVCASKGAADLSEEFKRIARNDSAKIIVSLRAQGMQVSAQGMGNRNLLLSHPTDLVVRKSAYTCERTLMIFSDLAAYDFPEKFVRAITNPDCRIAVKLVAESNHSSD